MSHAWSPTEDGEWAVCSECRSIAMLTPRWPGWPGPDVLVGGDSPDTGLTCDEVIALEVIGS